ncbi:4-oxalocrotonate tautomerase family protein [Streptomyces misionensis]
MTKADRCGRGLLLGRRRPARWTGPRTHERAARAAHDKGVQSCRSFTVQQGPRDAELKRDLVKRVTDAFVDAYRIPAESVQVWIHEVPADSWGAAGRLTADK